MKICVCKMMLTVENILTRYFKLVLFQTVWNKNEETLLLRHIKNIKNKLRRKTVFTAQWIILCLEPFIKQRNATY